MSISSQGGGAGGRGGGGGLNLGSLAGDLFKGLCFIILFKYLYLGDQVEVY